MELNQLFATVMKDSNDAVIIFTPEGEITAWNKGAEKNYGYSEKEAKKMNIINTIVPDQKKEELLNVFKRIKNEEKIASFETSRMAKDGRILDVWLTITAIMEGNEIVAIATTERDITERKLIELELKQLAVVTRDSNDAIIIVTPEGTQPRIKVLRETMAIVKMRQLG